MSLSNIKTKLEQALLAQVLGVGHKAGMWHFEDEPDEVAFKYKVEELKQSILADMAGDRITPDNHKGPIVVGNRVLCGVCLEKPLKVHAIDVPHPLYNRTGIKGSFTAFCRSCKCGYKIRFEYPDDWAHGSQIYLAMEPIEEVIL